jgi:hypothetical protein
MRGGVGKREGDRPGWRQVEDKCEGVRGGTRVGDVIERGERWSGG